VTRYRWVLDRKAEGFPKHEAANREHANSDESPLEQTVGHDGIVSVRRRRGPFNGPARCRHPRSAEQPQ
jgi:hypothetical protein